MVGAVIGLTELLKQFGVSGKWNVLAAVLVGMAVSLGTEYIPGYTQQVVEAALLGLTAAGLYGLGKRAGSAIVNGRG